MKGARYDGHWFPLKGMRNGRHKTGKEGVRRAEILGDGLTSDRIKRWQRCQMEVELFNFQDAHFCQSGDHE